MAERIKLIWDFRGPNAARTAEHHAKHLAEFAILEKLNTPLSGTETINPMHHIAFLVIDKQLMHSLRERLKPTRGQIYDES
jgi:hypothetical protein